MSVCTVFLSLIIYFIPLSVLAASEPNSAQTAGGVTRYEQDIQRNQKLEKNIRKVPAQSPLENPQDEVSEYSESGAAVLVNEIQVDGTEIISAEDIKIIVAPYEGRELTLDDMQQVADLITDAYRKKGYITSRAYLPVQSIRNNVLIIKVLEAKTGSIDIRGNQYFKTQRLQRHLDIEPDGYFDFSALQRSLVYINEHPDRKAKAVLVPGIDPGTTDIIIDVADRNPMHAGFEYDNYGSRYIKKNRYSLILEHDNLLGFDDLFHFKGQISDDSKMVLQQVRYVVPVTKKWDVGAYAVNSRLKLAEEFDVLNAEGSAQIYGLFASHRLLTTENLDLRLNMGFDYKSVRNKILGEELSKDELRILKVGFDLDVQDPWGRNVLAVGLDSGFADFWGASDAKDDHASRSGAGARFDKGNFTYYRLQPLPVSATLLWKNIAQFTNHALVASEQFQAGGALNVRGYPAGEYSGDSGIYSSWEVSFPVYYLPKNFRVPFTQDVRWYDALRFVVFYDIATTHLNNPLAGEEDYETLRGYGYGLRLNIQDRLSLRCEVGYPHGQKPSDNDSAHPWVEFTYHY